MRIGPYTQVLPKLIFVINVLFNIWVISRTFSGLEITFLNSFISILIHPVFLQDTRTLVLKYIQQLLNKQIQMRNVSYDTWAFLKLILKRKSYFKSFEPILQPSSLSPVGNHRVLFCGNWRNQIVPWASFHLYIIFLRVKGECGLNRNNPKHLLGLQPQCARHCCNMLLFQLDAFYLQYMWWYSLMHCRMHIHIFLIYVIIYTFIYPYILFTNIFIFNLFSSLNIKLNIKSL